MLAAGLVLSAAILASGKAGRLAAGVLGDPRAGAGWLFLHERLGRARVGSALVVTAGLGLLIVWQ